MSDIPSELVYTASDEWVRRNDDGSLTVGITDYAQQQLGDLVYIETPEVGRVINAGDACGVVESVKAAHDIYAPVNGEVIAANEKLADTPDLVNSDPYGEGWMYRLRSDASLAELLDASAYQKRVTEASE